MCTLLHTNFTSKEKRTINKYWLLFIDVCAEVFRSEVSDVCNFEKHQKNKIDGLIEEWVDG